jgi:hypothetical protein
MLKKGFIAGMALYSSLAHEADILEMYRDALSEVFFQIAKLSSSQDVQKHLIGGVSQTGFTRLT